MMDLGLSAAAVAAGELTKAGWLVAGWPARLT